MPVNSPSAGKRALRRALITVVAIIALAVPAIALAARPPNDTTITILDISDWHAQLDPQPVGNPAVMVGGAEALSSWFQEERAANPNTLTLTAGDDFGASPPLSGFFNEEPSIKAQRLMGIQIGTFGNHNFDRGVGFLQKRIDQAADPNEVGQPFSYVSANLANRDANLRGVEDYKIFTIDDIKIAVIGLTNPEAPSLVFPGNFGTIVPSDPVTAGNAARAAARDAGAKVIVAIAHMGIEGTANGQAFGPLVDLAHGLKGFDVVIGDHTNFLYEDTINGALVVENLSKSLSYSRIELTVRRDSGKVIAADNTFVTPTSAGRTDAAIAAMLAPYRADLAPILNVHVGDATVQIPRSDSCGRSDGRLCESLIGNVVTDSMRDRYATDFAITNSGGIRANLTCPTTDLATDFCPAFIPPPYPITRGQTFGVLPFGNFTVTVDDVTGPELKALLENGFSFMPGANGRFPQVSGLCVTYDVAASVGSRVTGVVRQAADGSCTGTAVDLTAGTYTLALNDFMATGGDGYPRFETSRVNSDGVTLEQTLSDYLTANDPISPVLQGRIHCTTSGATACPTPLP